MSHRHIASPAPGEKPREMGDHEPPARALAGAPPDRDRQRNGPDFFAAKAVSGSAIPGLYRRNTEQHQIYTKKLLGDHDGRKFRP